LGGDVELAAKIGKDPFGQHLIDVMDSFGVSTKWMLQDENYFTTFAFVSLMEDGERDFYFNRGADGQLNRDEVDAINLEKFSIVHFGSATAFLPVHCKLLIKACFKIIAAGNIYQLRSKLQKLIVSKRSTIFH
jgi:fructokinase